MIVWEMSVKRKGDKINETFTIAINDGSVYFLQEATFRSKRYAFSEALYAWPWIRYV